MKNTFAVILVTSVFSFPAIRSSAQFSLSIGVNIRTAPPALPVYTQPPCPVEGYLWCPGYWAYDEIDGYYWVPGVWVHPPMPGYLWTPGYWGYSGGIYGWHVGYWGPHIGFYGGVNYGYGYGGTGFVGGEWRGSSFHYNTAVVNVNTTVVHNTYINQTVVNNTTINNTTVINRSSFNGGPGGTTARPSSQEQVAMRENHVQPTSEQFSHNQTASKDRNQFASVNNGRPAATAMNSVGGARFNQQGQNAPTAVARPAARMQAHPPMMDVNGNRHPAPKQMPANHPQPMQGNHPHAQPMAQPHPQPHAQQHPAPHGEPQGGHDHRRER